MHTLVRSIRFITILALTSPLHAEPEYTSLLLLPDLSPQLTSEDISQEFSKWKNLVEEKTPNWSPTYLANLKEAKQALGSEMPQVTSLTLYSLYPWKLAEITPPKLAKEYAQLPNFNDYPILGQFTIDHAPNANHWVDFLRNQILSGGEYGMSACEFSPRHGFRLFTPSGQVDILMCYSCGDLALIGQPKLYKKATPYLSPITGTFINQLFDKLNIPRDDPKKPIFPE